MRDSAERSAPDQIGAHADWREIGILHWFHAAGCDLADLLPRG